MQILTKANYYINKGTPSDTTATSNITGLSAVPGGTIVVLSWTNPADADLFGIRIVWKSGSAPVSTNDGNYTNIASSESIFTNKALDDGTDYYYRVYTFDEAGNFSSGSAINTTTLDLTPPGLVTSLTIKEMDSALQLKWINPGDADFAGIRIVRNLTNYPVNINDGTNVATLLLGGSGEFLDQGLDNRTVYYYVLFSYDSSSNYCAVSSSNKISGEPKLQSYPDLDQVLIGPNPLKGMGTLYFTRLAQNTTIKIYSISGGLITTLEELDNDGIYLWDTTNGFGVPLASGVYFCIISTSVNENKIFTIMLIR